MIRSEWKPVRGLLGWATCAVLVGCGGAGDGGDGPDLHQDWGESWTVMVYMVADNDLEEFVAQDLYEMMSVGSATDFNLVVQIDRSVEFDMGGVGNLPDWHDTKRLMVHPGGLEEVTDLGELSMGNPAVLADFIAWAVPTYPADRYALIFWDHGAGWPGFGGDDSTPDHDLLSLAELRAGLADGLSAASLDRFALIGFDACLMASFEVATALRPFGEYLLASEELVSGHGWNYESLGVIRGDPTLGPIEMSLTLMDGFEAQAIARGKAADITLSLVDLYALDDLDAAMAELASLLIGDLNVTAPHIGRQRNATLTFGETPDPYMGAHTVDIGHLATRLTQGEGTFADVAARIHAGLDRAVVAEVAGPITAQATGLSVYFPPRAAFHDSEYTQVPGSRPWNEFLLSYYDVALNGPFTPPAFTNPDRLASYQLHEDGIALQGSLDPAGAPNVAHASLGYGLVDEIDSSIYLLADEPADHTSTTVEGFWDYSVLTIAQGPDIGYLYISFSWTEDDNMAITIPFEYVPAGSSLPEYVVLAVTLDEDWLILQESYYLVTDSGPGEFTPQAGSIMYPLIQTVDPDGYLDWAYSTSTGFDPTAPFELTFEYLPPQTHFYAELLVSDFAGNEDYVYVEDIL